MVAKRPPVQRWGGEGKPLGKTTKRGPLGKAEAHFEQKKPAILGEQSGLMLVFFLIMRMASRTRFFFPSI